MSAISLRFAGGLGTSLRALANTGAGPKWNQIFPMGTFHNGGWPPEGVTVDKAFCEAIVANWKKHGGALAVDYFHKTNEESAPNDERVASGWMKDLEAREDGVYALIDWTAKARAKILAGELANISPEFQLNGVDARTGLRQGPTLVCAALLNNQAFKEMPRVAAAAVPLEAPAPAGETNVMEKILAAALAALSLKSDATEADVTARAKVLKEQETTLAALKTEADSLRAASTNVEPLQAKLTALNGAVEMLKAANAELVAKERKVATDALISELQNDGKGNVRIIAAQVEQVRAYADKLGVDEARKFYASMPIIKKLGEQGFAGTDAVESAQGAYVKLRAQADELVKAGVKADEALIRAMELNPELTKATSSLTSPRS